MAGETGVQTIGSRGRASVGLPVLLALLLPLATATGGGTAAREAVERPNVVLILLDDLDAYSISRMPKTSALLSANGVRFENFFVTDPLCCPSRASILRGQHVHNHGVKHVVSPEGGFPTFHAGPEQSTLATWLDDAGYGTALIGKYLNEYPAGVAPTYVPPGWDRWMGWIDGHYYGYEQNLNGTVVSRGERPEDYATDVESAYANDWLREVAAAGAPFFLHLSPRAPHGPITPAYRHRSAAVETTAPRPPSFNEFDVSDKPAWVQAWPLMDDERIGQVDVWHRQRLRTLLAADEMVGDLVATLKAAGEYDNTYVVFTSDNGYGLGQHRVEGKGTPYEESIKVPLVVVGPDVEPGTVDELALNIDLAPTIAELAGVATPDFVDGRSLVPLLRGEGMPGGWRQAALIESYTPGSSFPASAVDAADLPHGGGIGGGGAVGWSTAAGTPTVSEGSAEAEEAGRATQRRERGRNASERSDRPGKARDGRRSEPSASSQPPDMRPLGPPPGWAPTPSFLGLRTADRLYVEYATGERELYDLRADPHQLNNLAKEPTSEREAEVGSLATWLDGLRDCAAAECRNAEEAPPAGGAVRVDG
jgi:arylsulfatase A-like enzyme